MLSFFLDSQNLQLVNTLPLTVIWWLHDFLFQRYGQICEFRDEKRHVVAILKIPVITSCPHSAFTLATPSSIQPDRVMFIGLAMAKYAFVVLYLLKEIAK
jgi:hypothetical protein